MKIRHIIPLTLFSAATLSACEDLSMCEQNEDCRNMCLTYENNAVAYVCTENQTCKCLFEEATICDGNTETDKCQSICDNFYPGKIGVCIMAKCECRDPNN